VLIMLTIPAVNAVFDNSLNWSLFVIVSVLEPSTGKHHVCDVTQYSDRHTKSALPVCSLVALPAC
jgi:hypothetical protein